ncbi:chorismate-binding protein [Auraticoccus monumenti]|uniref:Para-aminobenzoate synthetase / 4-amino-4-deoxychorismate lyase n=1 Tax=Auraticoccus monumenti TaxID=675864 RepID=A0A1G7EA14_9ACTN|nr:chorismate-binding protein [Auraticoccus monumenti]SDE60511.1 para-aminobenzoate synthetase / 4-amino-4-deoxychorismate lyase [Auraticoccus monumenti]
MLARFDDLLDDRALVVDSATEVLRADTPAEVVPLLQRLERATAEGRWAFGYLGYEAAAALDPDVAARAPVPGGPPLAWFALTDAPRQERALASVPSGSGWSAGPWVLDWSAAEHAERVHAVRAAIAAGDTYQANLTTTARSHVTGDLLQLYADLARRQRGAHHAYLDLGDHVVASASPELFLRWSGDTLLSRPMKGTAARRPSTAEDLAARDALLASAKERAENLMIVDMVRNDLSRVALPGTVAVHRLFHPERYESVWQLTSDVEGRVPPGTGLLDVLRALFPCASITGAPRAATMALLAGLEPRPRGVYTGVIGWLAPPTEPVRASFNVAIRTVVVDRRTGAASYGVGGGITWSSDPAAEHAELLAKTRVLTQPADEVELIETLGARRTATGLELVDLDAHLARLAASAEHLGFRLDAAALRAQLAGIDREARVRVTLARDGATTLRLGPLPADPTGPVRLVVDPEPVDPESRWLHHKTTRREHYETRRARHPEADDVLLVNTSGHVTESAVANLAVRLDGGWWTPPTSDGLLPGVRRGRLLAEGRLAERSLTPDDVRRAEGLALVSSLRGWRTAVLLPG